MTEEFAVAFGDALREFLKKRAIPLKDAAASLGVTKQALSTYWTEDAKGKRRKPRAELLFQACVELGFEFEYRGHRITAGQLFSGKNISSLNEAGQQLFLPFNRQFNLTDEAGELAVKVTRPAGHVEFSISLRCVS